MEACICTMLKGGEEQSLPLLQPKVGGGDRGRVVARAETGRPRLGSPLWSVGQDEVQLYREQQPAEVPQGGSCGSGNMGDGAQARWADTQAHHRQPCRVGRLAALGGGLRHVLTAGSPPCAAGALHGSLQPAEEADERAAVPRAAQQIRSERAARDWPGQSPGRRLQACSRGDCRDSTRPCGACTPCRPAMAPPRPLAASPLSDTCWVYSAGALRAHPQG